MPLDVQYDSWILNGFIETDVTQRYAGWLAYRQADSFWPLTFSPMISFPFGDYTSLADSIPAAELFFKLLGPLLPPVFQFCGLLCLGNMMLQSLLASRLIRRFTGQQAAILCGTLLFCLSPVLLERMFRHTSLSFHWMILLAMLLYFEHDRRGTAFRFAALLIASVWFHLYFTPMIAGFFLAWILDSRSSGRLFGKLGCFAGGIAGSLVSMKLLGILGMGMENTSGYGSMGMNLNALFNPVSLDTNWWVPGGGKLHWSAFLPMRALARNNLESFNYLGLGVLLSLAFLVFSLVFALVRRTGAVLPVLNGLVCRHLFLILFLGFSTAFAVSNTVCAFSYELFTVPLNSTLTSLFSAFRASGRLFWPVNYMLLLLAVLHWPHSLRRRKAACLALAAVTLIQIVDLSPALHHKHSYFASPQPYSRQARADEFMSAADGSDTVFFLELRDDRPLCTVLLKNGIRSNLWLISRDGYGVDRAQAAIDQTAAALLRGENPYPECTYVTQDAQLAAGITQNPGFTETIVGEDHLIHYENQN